MGPDSDNKITITIDLLAILEILGTGKSVIDAVDEKPEAREDSRWQTYRESLQALEMVIFNSGMTNAQLTAAEQEREIRVLLGIAPGPEDD